MQSQLQAQRERKPLLAHAQRKLLFHSPPTDHTANNARHPHHTSDDSSSPTHSLVYQQPTAAMHNNAVLLDQSTSDSTSLLPHPHNDLTTTAKTVPLKPLIGAAAGPAALAPYYLRHWLCFFVLGIINNFHFVIVSSAYSLALSFDALSLIGIISWATVILGMAARVVNTLWLLNTSSYLRVMLSCLVAAVGLVMLVLSTRMSFWVAIIAICLIGAYSAMGENVVLGYLRHFSPSLTGAWSAGTGISGVAGTIGYLLMYSVFGWSNELIYALCVPTIIIHVLAFHYIFETSKVHILSTAAASPQSAEGEDALAGLPHTAAPPSSATSRYQHIWRVFQAVRSPAVHLALVYFLEYVCIVGFAAASNPAKPDGDWWYNNAYEILSFCYQAGVLVSRSSISFVQIRRIEWLSIAQTVNFFIWFAQAYWHFIPLPMQFILMVWVGLMGGGMYVNVFYLLQRSDGGGVGVETKDKELAINLVATGYYVGIIGSSLFEIILLNTILKH